MAQPTIEQLLTRIETLEGRQRSQNRRRGARTLLSVVALAALMAVPIGVFANHSFTDVPNSHTFHTVIGRVKGAGITAGCTATTYCPDANVTRGQMAAFLARTGGRVATAGIAAIGGPTLSTSTASPTVLATVSIKAGDVTGGVAMVHFTGTMTVYATSGVDIPAIAIAYIREVGTDVVLSNYGYAQIDVYANGVGVDTIGLVGAVAVPTGVTKTYEIVVFRPPDSTATLSGFATLSALYVPFAGDGTNAVPATAPESRWEDSPLLGP
jgi:hypothetical protein